MWAPFDLGPVLCLRTARSLVTLSRVQVAPLVQSAVEGYKVCVLAYGQQGAGKTFTMLGTSAQEVLHRGVLHVHADRVRCAPFSRAALLSEFLIGVSLHSS